MPRLAAVFSVQFGVQISLQITPDADVEKLVMRREKGCPVWEVFVTLGDICYIVDMIPSPSVTV